MEAKTKEPSPLQQLLSGVVNLRTDGARHDIAPFTELIEEGWEVIEGTPAGALLDKKKMVVPLDESDDSFFMRVHEQVHTVRTPRESFAELARKAEVPWAILNAFEDCRINGWARDEVQGVAEILDERVFPISVSHLASNVASNKALRGKPGHAATVLSDEELRVLGVTLMAASEAYSHAHEVQWSNIASICGLNEAQTQEVVTSLHQLKELTFEEMVQEIHRLVDIANSPDWEPPAAEGEGDGDGDGEEGEGEGEGQGEDEGQIEIAVEADGASTRPAAPGDADAFKGVIGIGPTKSDKGIDHKESLGPLAMSTKGASTSEVKQALPKLPPPAKRPHVERPFYPKPRNELMERVSNISAALDLATKANGSGVSSRVSLTQARFGGTKEAVQPWWRQTEAKVKVKQAESMKKTQRAEQITKEYGVTIKEENTVANYFSYRGRDGDPRCPMKWVEFELSEKKEVNDLSKPIRRRKPDRVGYMHFANRAHLDGKIFRRKQRRRKEERTGSVLLDLSGSMSPSSAQIARLLGIAPHAVVAGYGGDDCSKGQAAILAANGLYASQRQLAELIAMGGGNSVDLPALEWLAQQPMPRIWVSDGFCCGTGNDREHAHLCFQTCRAHGIVRIPTLGMLLGEQALYNNLRDHV